MRGVTMKSGWLRASLSALAIVATVVTAAATALAHDQTPATAPTGPILLKGGDLYTVADGVLRATDLLIEDGTIRRIGKNLSASGATVIDVSGKRVYPGLIAAQTNIGLVEISSVRATRDSSEVGSLTPEVEAHVAYNPDSEIIPTVRSEGITTVQVVPGGGRLAGRPMLIHLDGWNKEDAAVELTSGMQMSWPSAGINRAWWSRTPPEEQRKNQREAREQLEELFQAARGYHLLRGSDPTTPVDLRWEAMRPIFAREQPVFISANDYRQIVEAVAFAQKHEIRAVIVGGREAHLASDLLVEYDVPVILGAIQALPPHEDSDYDHAFRLPAMLDEAGVMFAIGPGGNWNSRNLAFHAGQATGFGLNPEVALRSITLSVAEILGIDDRQGTLETGKRATLFVSRGDVMDMLGHRVEHMFIEGRAIDLNDRHKTLYEKYRQK